jgi:hypothetical protein
LPPVPQKEQDDNRSHHETSQYELVPSWVQESRGSNVVALYIIASAVLVTLVVGLCAAALLIRAF